MRPLWGRRRSACHPAGDRRGGCAAPLSSRSELASIEGTRLVGLGSRTNLGGELADCLAGELAHFCVELEELGSETLVESEHVVELQLLAITVDTGTDSDRRNAQPRGDLSGQLLRDQLEHDRR